MDTFIMTASEAAEYLRIRQAAMIDLLKRGEIPAIQEKEGAPWKIPREALHEYVMERAKREAARRRSEATA